MKSVALLQQIGRRGLLMSILNSN